MYNGVNNKNFELFLKEAEFKFNNPDPINQLKILKKWIRIYNKQGLK